MALSVSDVAFISLAIEMLLYGTSSRSTQSQDLSRKPVLRHVHLPLCRIVVSLSVSFLEEINIDADWFLSLTLDSNERNPNSSYP